MGSSNVRPGISASQRRSQRILLTMPVLVTGVRLSGKPFSERTETKVVNAHGALIQLHENLSLGQIVKLTNIATGEVQDCTVVDVNSGQAGAADVGVEFIDPAPRFWRVSFPPADWSPRNPEAKRFASSPQTILAPEKK